MKATTKLIIEIAHKHLTTTIDLSKLMAAVKRHAYLISKIKYPPPIDKELI